MAANLDRVMDAVLRSMAAPEPDPAAAEPVTGEVLSIAADAVRDATLADLCGHVSYALRSLDAAQRPPRAYRGPTAPQASRPTLDILR